MAERDAARTGEAWRERLRARRGGEAVDDRPLDLDPRSAYELLTRQMVAGLAEELRENPSNDAKNRPLDSAETARDTGTNQLPYTRQQSQHTPSVNRQEGEYTAQLRASRLVRRVVRLWHIVLAVAGGLITIGTAARTLYALAEWLWRWLSP